MTISPSQVNIINGAILNANSVVTTTVSTKPVTVNALSQVTPASGMRAFVVDSTTNVFGAPIGTTGGGAYAEPVYYYAGKWLVGSIKTVISDGLG
jgi:hypothetical protein